MQNTYNYNMIFYGLLLFLISSVTIAGKKQLPKMDVGLSHQFILCDYREYLEELYGMQCDDTTIFFEVIFHGDERWKKKLKINPMFIPYQCIKTGKNGAFIPITFYKNQKK